MKVYLINPPASDGIKMVREGRCMQRKGAWTTVWPPVTLATMAGMLLRDSIEVVLNDCIVEDMNYEQVRSKIAEFKPDLIVINTATASINSDLTCAKIAKETYPKIKTLAFGLHVSVLADETLLKQPDLDYIIRGEPEFCLLELVKKLREGDILSRINGLSYRHNSQIYHNPNRGFSDDLNNFTFPAWEFINVNNYLLPLSGEPFLLVTTSKGCPHSCIFCPAKPFYGSQVRFRKPKTVVDEMVYVNKKFKVKQFLIWSESFTENRDYVIEFCSELRNCKFPISWVSNSRVDKVDLELLNIMKESGCWMVGYGIESGDQGILDRNKKGITIKQIEDAVKWSKLAGLEVTAHVIFGLPGETLDTGSATINWLKRLDIDFAQFYCAVPWPSTPLYGIAKEKGWLATEDWRMYEQNYYIMDIETIKPKEVEHLRKMAIKKFYFYPKRLFKLFKKINSFRKISLFLNMVKEFLSWV